MFKIGCVSVLLLCIINFSEAKIAISVPCNDVSVVNGRGIAVFSAQELDGEAGQPYMPVYTCGILLPPDADLSSVAVSVEGVQEELLTGEYLVNPALPPMTITGPVWIRDVAIVDGKDVDVYSANEIFPATHAKFVDIGKKNCYKMVDVEVHLFRYNPVTKTLYQMKKGMLTVDYDKERDYRSAQNKELLIPYATKEQVRRLVVNYDQFADRYDADFNFTAVVKMAIITTNAIKTGAKKFDAFLASKKARGIEVQVVTETEWGSGAEGIRKWLQDNYQKLGIHHVLLIGNPTGDVPMMNFPGYARANCPSEWPYAQLTGDFKSDKKCEVTTGRFPVYNNDLNALDAIMEKTIAYETAKKDEIAWRKNILFAGPGYNKKPNDASTPLNGAYNDFVVPTPPWKAYRIYGTRWDQPTGQDKIGTETAVVEQWKNNKYGIVDWATHGAPTSAQDVLSAKNTITVGGHSPAYVFCGSCSNASPSNTGNLTYSVLRNCGIGSIGGTNLTYYGGDYKTSGSDNAWAYWFAGFLIRDTMVIGDAFNALREMAPNSYAWMNRGPYVLYGDPTLGINTCSGGTELVNTSHGAYYNDKLLISQTRSSQNTGILFRFKTLNNPGLLKIYSLSGALMNTISMPKGTSIYQWNVYNNQGSKLGAGVYFAKLYAGEHNGGIPAMNAKFIVK